MNNKLFRKKSIEKISSPEQLTDYIKVTNPGIWMILTAIVIILIGVCIWGIYGKMDTKMKVVITSESGDAVCYIKESDISSVKEGMSVLCGDKEYQVSDIPPNPVIIDDSFSEYALHVGNLVTGEWVFALTLNGAPADGVYSGEIVIESISPMAFVFN